MLSGAAVAVRARRQAGGAEVGQALPGSPVRYLGRRGAVCSRG